MITIGDIIRTNRLAQKMTQEDLASGLCTVSNLSRIENGSQIPSRATYEALMGRMGLPAEVFPSFTNESEVKAFRLKHQINQMFRTQRYDEAERLLDKLVAENRKERIYKQFVQYVRAMLLMCKDGQPETVLEMLENAAKMSIKDISPEKILHQLLTEDELTLLDKLAIAYDRANQRGKGIEMRYALKEYIERKVMDDERISPLYTAILFGLSNWVGQNGQFTEALKLCDIGIHRCIEYGAFRYLARLLFNKGYSFVMLDRVSEAKEFIQEAYFVCKALGEADTCSKIFAFANEHDIAV